MKLKMLLLLSSVAGLTFVSCNGKGGNSSHEVVPAIDLTAMDTTINPGENFYLFANKGWMDANPLKPAYSRYGAFDMLRDLSIERIHGIVDSLAKSELPKKGTNAYRVSVLYKQAMDSVKRNETGFAPVKPFIDEITAVTSKEELVELAAKKDNRGEATLFGTYVYADDMNSDMNIMHVSQPSLALPNRDYYLAKDAAGLEILKSYNEHVLRLLALAGYNETDAKRIADNNMAISKQLAEMSYSPVELRDSRANYHMLEVKKFAADNKGFNWARYITLRDLDKVEKWDVSQIKFFEKFDKWYPTADLNALKDFLVVGEIESAAGYLSDDFVEENFNFYGKVLSGRKEMHPRWRRSVNLVESVLGEALGQIYVEKYFPAEAKERMTKLVSNLQNALSDRIAGLEWMSDATKAKAQEKLKNFTVKIGYPDKWKDYSKMNIDADKSFYENLLEASRFEHQRNMDDLGKPVDRTRWLMNPQEVNAYYMPTTNEICFPAGILQPPFFNVDADDAVNYGAIGVVIGHEMTHGFDDQGREFDKDGNMNNWWTEEDSKKFQETTAKLADQFDQIQITPDLKANGKLTLGENIADQGGLLIARLALNKALNGKEPEPIDGFTASQRFYIAYARVWGQNITDKERIRLTKEDPHSLGEWRVNQTLRNIDDFYEAFGIKEGSKMYLAPESRVLVW